MISVTIEYYAILREQVGHASETYETSVRTVHELYEELVERYGIAADRQALKVAVNAEFSTWDHVLEANDTVVFVPPVAGG